MTEPFLNEQLRRALFAETSGAREIAISIDGRSIAVECVPGSVGLELRCAIEWVIPPNDAALRALEDLGLTEPGDTAIGWADGRVIVTRTIIDMAPRRLLEAVYATGKAAIRAERLFQAVVGAPTPPRDAQQLDLTRVEAALRDLEARTPSVTVAVRQPAWKRPESSGRPVAHLDPGTVYTLVSRSGDWAEVLVKGGRKVFTDGRTVRET